MIFNERHHNHEWKYLSPTAILSQDENARDFQIYDASLKFDPENVSIVKTLDAHLTMENFEIFFFFYIFVFSRFFRIFKNFIFFKSRIQNLNRNKKSKSKL